jgi:4-hydroxybutyrate CoA-transferase
MDWETLYQSRIVSAEEAVHAIKSGDRVFMTGNCSIPQKLLAALVDYAPQLQNVEICHALTLGASDYIKPEMEGHLRVNSLFIGGNVRQAIQDGRADFTPVLLSEFPLLFKNRVLPLDAALLHLSPPDEQGYCTYGIEAGLTKTAAESARIRIAEINPNMPRTLGDTLIHVKDIDYIVPVDYQTHELPLGNDGTDGVVEKIAGYIADIIPDGATLQLGIGGIPDAVLKFLHHKKDLGIHSELFSDGVMGLVEAGVITNARKTLHPGKITAGFILGSQKLYRWVDNNPLIELQTTEHINNPFVIAKNYRQVAINSAIEVDFTGQVCSDSIGCKFYSGAGGQLDFIYGASLSEGGLPIIALPSTTTLRNGTKISKIVPTLKNGAGVITTRSHVHYVVTEYGMVNLYGKSVRERTRLLISIAHPDFRSELEHQAKLLCYL